MKTALGICFMIVSLTAAVAVCGDVRVNRYGDKIWTAPDGRWEVGTQLVALRVGELADLLSKLPDGVDVAKVYQTIVNEPGLWMGFAIRFISIEKLVFTKNTKFVLIDETGKQYESEACLFTPDRVQSQVYDTRKMAVVLTSNSVWSWDGKGHPSGMVKFAKGSFRMEDIVEFEVVGAIEDTTYRDTK